MIRTVSEGCGIPARCEVLRRPYIIAAKSSGMGGPPMSSVLLRNLIGCDFLPSKQKHGRAAHATGILPCTTTDPPPSRCPSHPAPIFGQRAGHAFDHLTPLARRS